MKLSLGTWRNPYRHRPRYSRLNLTTSLSAGRAMWLGITLYKRFLQLFKGNLGLEVVNELTRGDALLDLLLEHT